MNIFFGLSCGCFWTGSEAPAIYHINSILRPRTLTLLSNFIPPAQFATFIDFFAFQSTFMGCRSEILDVPRISLAGFFSFSRLIMFQHLSLVSTKLENAQYCSTQFTSIYLYLNAFSTLFQMDAFPSYRTFVQCIKLVSSARNVHSVL